MSSSGSLLRDSMSDPAGWRAGAVVVATSSHRHLLCHFPFVQDSVQNIRTTLSSRAPVRTLCSLERTPGWKGRLGVAASLLKA